MTRVRGRAENDFKDEMSFKGPLKHSHTRQPRPHMSADLVAITDEVVGGVGVNRCKARRGEEEGISKRGLGF